MGILLLALALASFCIPLTLGTALSGTAILALSALALLAIAAFVRHERATPAPLLRFALLRDRRHGSGLVAMLLVSSIFMTMLVVGPFHLSQTLGLAAVQTGCVMSVGALVAALTGFPAGRLVDTVGLRVGSVVSSVVIKDRDGAPDILKAFVQRYPLLRRLFADSGHAGPGRRDVPKALVRWSARTFERPDTAEDLEVLPRRWAAGGPPVECRWNAGGSVAPSLG